MFENNIKKTVLELLNGDIKRLREAGYSFELIAEKGGVTRERIRQVINKYYPGTEPKTLKETEAARTLGVSGSILGKLRRQGHVHPMKIGHFYRYNEKTLDEARNAMVGSCRICGNPVPAGNSKLCKNCSAIMKDPKSRLSLPGERERHHESVKRYRETHKEKIKIGRRKSDANYRASVPKMNYENSVYAVRLPHLGFRVGERFKAIDNKDKNFLLADGRTIPALKTIKVSGPEVR